MSVQTVIDSVALFFQRRREEVDNEYFRGNRKEEERKSVPG
jgi:hypothetical protein